MLFLVALLAFAAEVAAFVAVAHQIGWLGAIVLLVVVSALGPFIVRRVGLGVLAHTRERLALGEPPTRELLDGLVVLAGGALICIPGFVGDAVGLLLMVGPVRHLVIRLGGRRLARRAQTIRLGPVIDVGGRTAGPGVPDAPGRARPGLDPPAGRRPRRRSHAPEQDL